MSSILQFRRMTVRERGEMLSLTDMWRAAGAAESKRPANWEQLQSTRDFGEHVAECIVGKPYDECFQVVRGGTDPGTWAHWQVAMAYAKYLSPEFHAWCNEVVRAHMTCRAAPSVAVLAPEVEAVIDRVANRIAAPIVGAITEVRDRVEVVECQVAEVRDEIGVLREVVSHHLTHKRRRPPPKVREEIIDYARHRQRECPFCDAPMFEGDVFVGHIHHHDKVCVASVRTLIPVCGDCNRGFEDEPAKRCVIDAYHERRSRFCGPLFARRGAS